MEKALTCFTRVGVLVYSLGLSSILVTNKVSENKVIKVLHAHSDGRMGCGRIFYLQPKGDNSKATCQPPPFYFRLRY